ETTSSGSIARMERISARSAAGRCAPVEQTAILRSRVARPWRRSSTTSGLRVSTACPPQIMLSQHNCTGCAGGAEGRHGLAVQFQQYPSGVGGGHFKLVGGGEVPDRAGGDRIVQKWLAVSDDTDVRGGESGQRKIE